MYRTMMLVVGVCVLVVSQNTGMGQVPTNENLKPLEPLIGTWEGIYTIAEIAEGDDSLLPFKEGDELPLIVSPDNSRVAWSIGETIA